MTEWFLYIVRTRDDALYTGITTDIERRLAEHEKGRGTGARRLRGRGPLRLVYRKRIGDRGIALRVEHGIKCLSKLQKEALVRDAPNRDDLLGRLGINCATK